MSEFWDSFADNFTELGKAYLTVEGVKAQAGSLRAQAEYSALANYNPNMLLNPNGSPMSAQQLAALRAQGAMGIPTSYLLIGGVVALVALVLVLK